MEIRLRPGAKFHDGAPVTAETITKVLNEGLPGYMGPAFSDVDHVRPISTDRIEVGFKRPSPFFQEALEIQVRKPDQPTVGTGPFKANGASSPNELKSNPDYYLGIPTVDRIVVKNYPSVRAAWADLLRDQIDMLYEVSADALDSLSGATSVSIYSFTRPYQYVIAFNQRSPVFRSAKIRQALNAAIDRDALIRDGLGGRGTPSSGPIWTQHWALAAETERLRFSPQEAVAELAKSSTTAGRAGFSLRFKCLLPAGYERLGLVVKRQLQMVGVEMEIEEASAERVLQALRDSSYDAVFLDMVSGPSLFRTYQWWHSAGTFNPGSLGGGSLDAPLDQVRYARSDEDYRKGVAAFQHAVIANPPGIFLAWSERTRAVNRRFDVAAEPGRDILTTLRSWRPATDLQSVGRN
jgi:peptide/nickel transport system substrate-binding protein